MRVKTKSTSSRAGSTVQLAVQLLVSGLTLCSLAFVTGNAWSDPPVSDPPVSVQADTTTSAVTNAAAGADAKLAGRTVQQYSEQLSSKIRTQRLRAIHSLAAIGAPASVALQDALQHDDPAVRFLAATGLARLGGEPLNKAKVALVDLAKPDKSDELRSVRLAAAYALCAGGEMETYLPILIETIEYPERGTSCTACDFIAQLGPPAKAATKILEKVYAENKPGVKGGDYHVGGAAMNALRKIGGE